MNTSTGEISRPSRKWGVLHPHR